MRLCEIVHISVCVYIYVCRLFVYIFVYVYLSVCLPFRPFIVFIYVYVYVLLLCVLIYVLICVRYRCRLLIWMTLSDGQRRFAEYDDFSVADEKNGYRLYVGNCTAGDAGPCYMRIRNNYYPQQLHRPQCVFLLTPRSREGLLLPVGQTFPVPV